MKNINKRERKNFSIVFTIALVFLLTTAIIPGVRGASAVGASAVDLGSACNFAILSKSGITNIPTSAITGDLGLSPMTGASVEVTCGEMPGYLIYGVDDAYVLPDVTCYMGLAQGGKPIVDQAILDMEAAYTDAAGRAPDVTELGAGNIGGLTLAPGVYKWGTGVTIPTDVTLSGGPNDVWIFQISGTLDIASGGSPSGGAHVILSGGAQAQNVYWQVAGATTLGTYSTFNGNILAATNIALQTGATLNGKALAQTAVTLDKVTVNGPTTCAIPTPTPEFPLSFLPAVIIVGTVAAIVLVRKN